MAGTICADRAAPEFIEQDADEGKTPKTRLDWPAEFKDEVLARLLALNAARAAAERAAGLVVEEEDDDEEIEDAVECRMSASRAHSCQVLTPLVSDFAPCAVSRRARQGLRRALRAQSIASRCVA